MNFLSGFMKIVSYLPALIVGVESFFGAKKGEDKAASVLGVAQLVVNGIPGDSIKDRNAFNDGLKAINDGVVKCLNASIWHA